MALRVGDEGLLSGVKPAQRRVASGTYAGSVVVEELVPFYGVKGKEKKGTRDYIRNACIFVCKSFSP